MKNILLISQYFYPENFRVNDMACEWVRRGYRVTVLTGIPNYPAGRYFEGYGRKHRTRETWNGVDIIRIPLTARGSSTGRLMNAAGLAANYLSFVISGWKWVKSKEAASLHADLVFTFEVSPMTQALIGVWYAKKYRIPHFLYIQDLWPENVELVTGIHHPLLIRPIDHMVDYIYKHADQIFVTGKSFVDAVTHRSVPVDSGKVHYWPQYAETFYRPLDKAAVIERQMASEIPDDGAFKIIFTGNIGFAQGLDILPGTAALLKQSGKQKDVRFVIVGSGRYRDELVKEIADHRVQDMFLLIPAQDARRIPALLAVCDVAYISCSDPQTIPAKVQSCMACGKCILASAGKETGDIIRAARCGICCDFADEKGLADAVLRLMDKREQISVMGQNARNYYMEHFEKSRRMDEMDGYFKENRTHA